jgi:hypothetical protein
MARASSFFSGIIREPLAGVPGHLPGRRQVSHPLASPANTVAGLIAVFEAVTAPHWAGRLALNLPALNVRVCDMLDALEAVAGKPQVRCARAFRARPAHRRHRGQLAARRHRARAARAGPAGRTPRVSPSIIRQYIDRLRGSRHDTRANAARTAALSPPSAAKAAGAVDDCQVGRTPGRSGLTGRQLTGSSPPPTICGRADVDPALAT